MTIEPEKLKAQFDKSWYELLKPEMHKEYFQHAMQRLKEESIAKRPVYPKFKDMFRPWLLPFDKVRVVIVAEQPNKQSDGLAFSTRDMPQLPADTIELFKEIYFSEVMSKQKGVGLDDLFCCGDLQQWINQGVMLMNGCLTTGSDPKEHKDFNWHQFTCKALELLNSKENPIVFLMVNVTKPYEKMIDHSKHEVIYVKKLHESGCFVQCNKFLKERYSSEINWGVWPHNCQQYVIKVMNEDWKNIERLKDQVKQEWRIPTYFKPLFDRVFGPKWFEELTMFDSPKLYNWIKTVEYSEPLKTPKKGKELLYETDNFLYWTQQVGRQLNHESIIQIEIE